MKRTEKKENKQTYEKPKLRIIELAADEVMATGCKTGTTIGPSNILTCEPAPCSIAAGS